MSKRQVLHVPGMPHHQAPIPTALRIGNMVFSSALVGEDPATGSAPPQPERQAQFAFQHMRSIVEAAGGTTDDIAKVTVYLKDMQYRNAVNTEWTKMFPDADDRPVRHAIKADLPGAALLQIEFTAVL